MQTLPIFNEVSFLDVLPVRVSTQAFRTKDFTHFHSCTQLCFVLSGELHHTINGTQYIQRRGSCSFVLPYMSHKLDVSNSEDTPIIIYVWFNHRFLIDYGYSFSPFGTDTAGFEGMEIPEVCNFVNLEQAINTIHEISSEFDKKAQMSYAKLAELIASLFRFACVKSAKKVLASNQIQQFEKIEQTLTYITKMYHKKITTNELCQSIGMSRRSFTYYFREMTRLSPSQFILAIRIYQAFKLLLTSDMLYEVIALRCGLQSNANMSRVFSKYMGLSPTKFRETYYKNTRVSHQITDPKKYTWVSKRD